MSDGEKLLSMNGSETMPPHRVLHSWDSSLVTSIQFEVKSKKKEKTVKKSDKLRRASRGDEARYHSSLSRARRRNRLIAAVIHSCSHVSLSQFPAGYKIFSLFRYLLLTPFPTFTVWESAQ